jgi:hypothetical protein
MSTLAETSDRAVKAIQQFIAVAEDLAPERKAFYRQAHELGFTRREARLVLAGVQVTLPRVPYPADPHRLALAALHNEVIRLRQATG